MDDIKLLRYTIRGLNFRYNALKKINTLLDDSSDAEDYLDKSLGILVELMGASAGIALLKEKNEVKVRGFRTDLSQKEEETLRKRLYELDISPTALVSRAFTGEIELEHEESPDLSLEYRKIANLATGGVKNLTVLPLKSAKGVLGVIELYNIVLLGNERREALKCIGPQIGVSVELFNRLGSLNKRIVSLRKLTAVTEEVSAPRQIEHVLDVIIQNSLGFFSADGCSILLKDEKGFPEFVAVSGSKADQLKGKKLKKDEGIVGWVIQNKRPLLVGKVSEDDRFSPRIDSMTKMITGSIIAAPLMVSGEAIGVIEVVRSRKEEPFTETDLGLLTVLSSHASIAINKARLYSIQERWLRSTIDLIAMTIDTKEQYFPGHTEKVREYASLIASAMELTQERADLLDMAAAVQNIGKLVIPEVILGKEGELSDREWEEVKGHPEKSAEILSTIEAFSEIIPIILAHHERFDGSGYPNNLIGEEIPLLSRILTLADTYAALRGNRPYRRSLTSKEAIEEIKKESGKQFDPEIVKVFIAALKKRSSPE